MSPPRRQVTDEDLTALERQLERMQAHLVEMENTLAALDRKKTEVASSAAEMRSSVDEVQQDLATRREALIRAQRDRLGHVLAEAVAERDLIARRLAKRLAPVLDDLGKLDAARTRLDEAHAELTQMDGPRHVAEIPEEPGELDEQWQPLVTLVAADVDRGLADQLVDAASKSPLGHAIGELPPHLREAARQRRGVLLRDARARRQAELDDGAAPTQISSREAS
jgi:SMC interacting uncharacterized protein involved in chromosome segregation